MLIHTLRFRVFALSFVLYGSAAYAAKIDTAILSETVRILASDEFEGRAPGTAGQKRQLNTLFNNSKL